MSISKFIYSLVWLLLMPFAVLCAQESSHVALDSTMVISAEPQPQAPVVKQKSPVYQATYLSLDIFNPIATAFSGRFEASIAADVSLWHRLFPAIEIGVMGCNEQQDLYKYTTAGGFVKIGANYNFLNYQPDRKRDHAVFAGVRYGYSFTSYQLSDAQLSNNYWHETGTYATNNQVAHFGWLEFQLGVRVQVYKQFFMGLALEVKTFGHYYQNEASYPTYIAGFGSDAKATNFGLLYHLTYQFPTKK